MLHRILSIILLICLMLSLVSCGESNEDRTSFNNDEALKNAIEEVPADPIQQEGGNYAYWLQSYQNRIEELITEEPVDYSQLWNVYTALSYMRDTEWIFKSKLFSVTKEKKDDTYSEEETLADAASSVLDEMRLYFSEEEVNQWALQRIDHSMAAWDTMEVDFYKIEDSHGKVDIDASWEYYFNETIDPEILAQMYLSESTMELTLTFSDGTQIINTGEYVSNFGSIKMERAELLPGEYIDSGTLGIIFDEEFRLTLNEKRVTSDELAEVGTQQTSSRQNLLWAMPDNTVQGILEQYLIVEDAQYKVAGCFALAFDRYTWELTFETNDAEKSYLDMLKTLNTLTLNGIRAEDEMVGIEDLSSTISFLNMTETEKNQKMLYSVAERRKTGREPFEDDLTGTYVNEFYNLKIEIQGFKTTQQSFDTSDGILYFLTFQSGNARFECVPSAWHVYDDGVHRTMFYLDDYFPNMGESKIHIAHYETGEYTFYCTIENEDFDFYLYVYEDDGTLERKEVYT